MPRQRTLDFRGDGLGLMWDRLPERWRREVLAIYARLITRAAQRRRRTPQPGGDHSCGT
jgi:lauroyl/myristoyl acyltransferase